MTERILIHFHTGEERNAAKAILENVVEESPDTLIVLVHDSRDGEEEITNILNDAGVSCFVEKV